MKICLDRIEIENFRGIKKFSATFGADNRIYGENGIGKTSIYDAFLWLLYGKDSSGRKDFELRPLDKDNQPIRGLTVSVQGILDFDGVKHTFRKEHHENIIKKQLRGYNTLCWIDDVPKKVSEYSEAINEIIPENTLKLLTDIYFFCGKMHWTERRKILLEMAGKIAQPSGYDRLLSELKGRSIDDYKKTLIAQKKRYEAELAEIPPRIDELQRGLASYANAEPPDRKSIEAERLKIKNSIDALAKKRAALLDQEKARQEKIDRLNALKLKRLEREAELKNDTTGIQHLLDEKQKLDIAISDRKRAIHEVESAMQDCDAEIEAKKRKQASLQSVLQQIKTRYQEIKSIKIKVEDVTCPACGQPLPPDKIESIMAEHETKKKSQLFALAEEGNKTKKQIDDMQKEIDSIVEKRKALLDDLEKAQILFREAEEYRAERLPEIDRQLQHRPQVDPRSDTIWKQLTHDIEALEKDIGESVSSQLDKIEKERQSLERELEQVNIALLQYDRICADTARIKDLEAYEREISQSIASIDELLAEIDRYKAEQSALIEKSVNGLFKHVSFKMFKELLNGGFEDCCEATLHGVPYNDLSTGEKILVGVDVINALSRYYDYQVVLFLDNSESLTFSIETDMQVIRLIADPTRKNLEVETI